MASDTASLRLPDLPTTPEALAARRAELFRESAVERLERWAFGTIWALKPRRLSTVPVLAKLWAADLVAPQAGLPDPLAAPEAHEGVCGMVRDLSVPTLVEAYRRGLYTFAHFGPLKWFCPPQRCVLTFDTLHIGKNTRRLLRQGRYRVTFDRDFEGVIKACAGRRRRWHLTWITPRIMRAYADLFDAGYVHSFEVWNEDGALVGGGYGVALGNVFFTESQFSHERDTSKIGFTVFNCHLARWGFTLNDAKAPAPTLTDMGFRCIPRDEFVDHLRREASAPGRPGRWQLEAEPAEVAAWKPGKAEAGKRTEPAAA